MVNQHHGRPFFVDVTVNVKVIPVLIDLGSSIYSIFSKSLVKRPNLPRTRIAPRQLRLAKYSEETAAITVDGICWAE